jgi:uncharacterized protein
MLRDKLATLVNICTRHAWFIVVFALMLSVVSCIYAVRTFKINTDVNQLISRDLPWRQRELVYSEAFQGKLEKILAVIDAPASELASAASKALAERISAGRDLFRLVQPNREPVLRPQRNPVPADRPGDGSLRPAA